MRQNITRETRVAAFVAGGILALGAAEARAQDSTKVGINEGYGLLSGAASEDTSSGWGIHVFGDFYPSSGPEVRDEESSSPMSPRGPELVPQQSIYTGVRWSFPIYRGLPGPALPKFFGMADVGVAFAGPRPGLGDSGFGFGLGFEARWRIPPLNQLVQPFGRVKWDFRAVQFNDHPTSGTLYGNAFSIAAGAHLVEVVDVHLMMGGTYSGGFAAGIGLGLGKLL